MSDTELEKLMPRCKTSDKEDFPDEHLDDSERCWNCRVWEAIDKEVTRSRIDELEHMENEMWYEDDHVTSKGSRTERIPQLKAELEKLEEGTDNG